MNTLEHEALDLLGDVLKIVETRIMKKPVLVIFLFLFIVTSPMFILGGYFKLTTYYPNTFNGVTDSIVATCNIKKEVKVKSSEKKRINKRAILQANTFKERKGSGTKKVRKYFDPAKEYGWKKHQQAYRHKKSRNLFVKNEMLKSVDDTEMEWSDENGLNDFEDTKNSSNSNIFDQGEEKSSDNDIAYSNKASSTLRGNGDPTIEELLRYAEENLSESELDSFLSTTPRNISDYYKWVASGSKKIKDGQEEEYNTFAAKMTAMK